MCDIRNNKAYLSGSCENKSGHDRQQICLVFELDFFFFLKRDLIAITVMQVFFFFFSDFQFLQLVYSFGECGKITQHFPLVSMLGSHTISIVILYQCQRELLKGMNSIMTVTFKTIGNIGLLHGPYFVSWCVTNQFCFPLF